LLDHLEQLQQALWCSVGSTAVTGLLRFSASRCVAGPHPASASKRAEPATEVVSLFPPPREEGEVCQDFLDWAPTTRDPFEGTWQHILSLVLTHPAWSSGEVFQEMQRQFPGRYRLAHLGTLQRRLRQIRAHLLDLMEEPWSDPLVQRDVPNLGSPQQEQHVPEAKLPDGPVETLSRLPLLSNEDVERRTLASTGSPGERQVTWPGEQLLPTLRAQSIESLIQSYLQELVTNGRLPKTLEWHQTALRQFQQYLMKERSLFLLTQVSQSDIDGWIANLHATPTARGSFLAASSMATYGRSVRAFWHWALREGHVQHLPFAPSTFPREEKKRLALLDPEAFDRLLLACGPGGENGEPQEWATARNRAILWVLLDTGLRVSELCELRLGDVDRASGTLHIRGQGARERQLLLSPPGRDQVRSYLEQYRCKSGSVAGGRAGEEYLFLTETYQPFTKNALTLLFARLKTRAGFTDASICPSLLRDTFAVRYLQAGGTVEDLGTQLGLRDLAILKRYVCAARPSSEVKLSEKSVQTQASAPGQGLQKRRRRRRRSSSATKRTQQRSSVGMPEDATRKEFANRRGDDP
jgi:site-specific recombinase XerD